MVCVLVAHMMWVFAGVGAIILGDFGMGVWGGGGSLVVIDGGGGWSVYLGGWYPDFLFDLGDLPALGFYRYGTGVGAIELHGGPVGGGGVFYISPPSDCVRFSPLLYRPEDLPDTAPSWLRNSPFERTSAPHYFRSLDIVRERRTAKDIPRTEHFNLLRQWV